MHLNTTAKHSDGQPTLLVPKVTAGDLQAQYSSSKRLSALLTRERVYDTREDVPHMNTGECEVQAEAQAPGGAGAILSITQRASRRPDPHGSKGRLGV